MKTKHIQHLYFRAGFGLDYTTLEQLRKQSKTTIISNLFEASRNVEPLEIDLSGFESYFNSGFKKPETEEDKAKQKELQKSSREKTVEFNALWIDRLTSSDAILAEKMTLFWANVFVCRDNAIYHMQRYNNMLRRFALGNFGEFVKAMAREASMSKYLNNRQNVKASPNENFARELMELFTLGVGNYSEADIKAAARAFTGWSFKRDGTFHLRKKQHDFGEKTFFGQTGIFNGDDIIDIILQQKQCARFICDKIYRYFVNPEPDAQHIEALTNQFYKNYDIKALMFYLFNSDWFYDQKNIGSKIKSPIELLIGIQKTVPITFQKKKQLLYLQKVMGQVLLYPPNVAGWKGDKNWIDSNTLMLRLKLPAILLNNAVINVDEKGTLEDDFEAYYASKNNKQRFIKTTIHWAVFEKEYINVSQQDLKNTLIIAKIDPDTDALLSRLKFEDQKNYCIQLMSIPEYQLC
ncbi:DUF1800 domain-containing protein [Formosa haliotis]|uniref:DUF1800 domain-containing protein n=1 Tax=Formosa haliotis TaxID=1555194 RepID=UPI0008266293|nr:DUF1800 domain-containing protein [Formosa haliotis]